MKARVNGHFGEWIQGRVGNAGTIGLVTVPCPKLFLVAERICDGRFSLDDRTGTLSLSRARAFLNDIGECSGQFVIEGNIPPGGGAGASTAALVALARAASVSDAKLVRSCIEAEGASDPLMLPDAGHVLWASRDGRCLATLATLPQVEIIGGFFGDPVRTHAADLGFPDVTDLARDIQKTLTSARLAAIASESAHRATEMRGPVNDPTSYLARELGALGHLRAHTGSARGLIFAPGTVPANAKDALTEAGFAQTLQFETNG